MKSQEWFRCCYLNDIVGFFIVIEELVREFLGEKVNGIENGAAERMVKLVLRRVVFSGELDLLDVFLELPVVDECVFPFRYELSFELL